MRENFALTFHNRTLTLDGQRFSGCRFINIELRFKGSAPFELDGNTFEGYLNLEFAPDGVDAQSMAAQLDRALYSIGYDLELLKQIMSTRHPIWRFHTLLPRSSRR